MNLSPSKQKQFQKGLEQLEEEGVMQVLQSPHASSLEWVLAVVGNLQFDVVAARLDFEYGVKASVKRLPYLCASVMEGAPEAFARLNQNGWEGMRLEDRSGRTVGLFATEWELKFYKKRYQDLQFKPF